MDHSRFILGSLFGVVLRPQRDFVSLQNHRRYVRSRDDLQLHGELKSTVSSDCDPFSKVNGTPIAPCGAIANSLFNGRLFYTCISLLRYNHQYNRADSALQWILYIMKGQGTGKICVL